jgi:hypothetical protein
LGPKQVGSGNKAYTFTPVISPLPFFQLILDFILNQGLSMVSASSPTAMEFAEKSFFRSHARLWILVSIFSAVW